MKVFQVTGLIFCFVISSLAFGQGTVIHEQFYSESLERTQDVNVYVPEDYEPDSTRILYPVIYLLHGGGVNYTYYSEIVAALDSLISIEIEPVIVVRPNGFYGPYSGMSWWSNSELNGQFEDYVVSDLVEFIESNYNASPERDKRCIMGHSMGGYGAMMIALKHTDIYCGVVSFSGVVHSTYTVQTYYIPDMLNEHGGSGPFSPDAGGYSTVIYSMAAAFSPNLDNPPYNLDLPVDDEGNIVDEVFDLWIHEDPAWLATQLDDEDSIAIYIDALDGEAFPIINRAFADTLDAYEIPYTMRVFPGRDHHRDLPQRYPAS
ncbi:MAG: alpha/beta hydrolase-fold protein, partial [Candidatus Electryonea clarkiae]|nr:alpha/beta hydrolase-fold protein [Candidatus Electryonea clarkiae]